MGDTRIGGPPPPPIQPDNTEGPDSVGSTSSPSETEGQTAIQQGPEPQEKTGLASGLGAAVKSDLNLTGNMIKSRLQTEFADASVNMSSTFAATPNTDLELSKMNVIREKTEDGSRMHFPNGVSYSSSDGVTSIEAPPGGRTESDPKTGSIIVRDAKENIVAELGKDGKLQVHSKLGEYVTDDSGKLFFHPKQKDFDINNLHKAGTIQPGHYEDYGISTDGKTMRFPNGMNFDLKTHNITVQSAGRTHQEIGKDGTRTFFNGENAVYKLDKNGLHIPTPDGTITMNGKGELSFEPRK